MTQSDRVWTVKEALDWTRSYLDRKGDPSPLLSARALLSLATGLTHLELYTRFDQPLSFKERDVLREAVARRGQGEPLQYIAGKAPFRHIEVSIRPPILIPRPETEVLVDQVIAYLEGCTEPLVADIGCGSGCIACSIALEAPNSVVWATDIDAEACALARENVRELELGEAVHVVEGDLASGIPSELAGAFDAVVSNPPYIPDGLMETLPREVRGFESPSALRGGGDGLDVFRRLLDSAARLLKEEGLLAVELHEESLVQARELARDCGYGNLRIVEDLARRPRILLATKGKD